MRRYKGRMFSISLGVIASVLLVLWPRLAEAKNWKIKIGPQKCDLFDEQCLHDAFGMEVLFEVVEELVILFSLGGSRLRRLSSASGTILTFSGAIRRKRTMSFFESADTVITRRHRLFLWNAWLSRRRRCA